MELFWMGRPSKCVCMNWYFEACSHLSINCPAWRTNWQDCSKWEKNELKGSPLCLCLACCPDLSIILNLKRSHLSLPFHPWISHSQKVRHYQLKPDYDVVFFFLVTCYYFVAISLKKRDRVRKKTNLNHCLSTTEWFEMWLKWHGGENNILNTNSSVMYVCPLHY